MWNRMILQSKYKILECDIFLYFTIVYLLYMSNFILQWNSLAYENVHGSCELTKVDKKMLLTIKYADDCEYYKKGKSISCELEYKIIDNKIIAQTHIDSPIHLMMTITINKRGCAGSYSTIHPSDCGTMRPITPRQDWIKEFGLEI